MQDDTTPEMPERVSGRRQQRVRYLSAAPWFLAACVAGGLSVVLGVMGDAVFLSTVVPIGVMVAYIWKTQGARSDVPVSILGDSYYYLGFILTLCALVASLISLSDSAEMGIGPVVRAFGSALVTTIVGLIARLVTTSFSLQTKERQERLEDEIEQNIARFSAQLDTLTTRVCESITRVHARSEDALGEMLGRCERVQNELLAAFEQKVGEGVDAVAASLEQLAGLVAQVEVDPDMISRPMTRAVSDIVESLTAHQQAQQAIVTNLEQLGTRMTESLAQSAGALDAHIERVETALAAAVEHQAGRYEVALGDIGEAILSSLGDITDLKLETQRALERQCADLAEALERVRMTVTQAAEPLARVSEQTHRTCDETEQAMAALTRLQSRLAEHLAPVEQGLERAGDLGARLEQLQAGVAAATRSLETLAESGQSAQTRMMRAAEATEQASQGVAEDISRVYRALADQIRALEEALD